MRFTRNEIRILVLLTIIFLLNLAFRSWQNRRLVHRPVSSEERAFEEEFLRVVKQAPTAVKKVSPEHKRKIDLNTANVRELTALPGIGPKTAAAIVALRKRRGGFTRVQDLLLVKGIGKKKLRAIQNRVVVSRIKIKGKSAR